MNFDNQLQQLVDQALAEDVGDGDHSTLSCIPPEAKGKAVLKIKQDGILAGMDVAKKIFHHKEPGSVFTAFKKDGDKMIFGEKAFEVEASVHTILQCERLVLNCLQRMSGIATLTKKYADRLAGYKTHLLDTRKTTPNFRLLEKEAVRIGGGVNHRFGLYDMIMLKDNHIDYCGSIETAIEKAYEYVNTQQPGLKIEVETRSIEDVKRVIAIGRGKVFRIMLDNFKPEQIAEAVLLIKEDFETEASG
jgi:nicotinate-nucleotide pyrophosphorylase (carboxylating)